jgi:hypothetical protein
MEKKNQAYEPLLPSAPLVSVHEVEFTEYNPTSKGNLSRSDHTTSSDNKIIRPTAVTFDRPNAQAVADVESEYLRRGIIRSTHSDGQNILRGEHHAVTNSSRAAQMISSTVRSRITTSAFTDNPDRPIVLSAKPILNEDSYVENSTQVPYGGKGYEINDYQSTYDDVPSGYKCEDYKSIYDE